MDDIEILLRKTEAQHLRAAHDSAEDSLAECSRVLTPDTSPQRFRLRPSVQPTRLHLRATEFPFPDP